MPRCKVCAHPNRHEIDEQLVAGDSHRSVAKQFSVSESSVYRHAQNHLPAKLVKAHEAIEVDQAVDLMAELRSCIEQVKLMRDACDRWLRDPDDPARYEVGPRAEDVNVVYWKGKGKERRRRKERLSAILDRLEGKRYEVEVVETKHADPRDLLLKALDRMDGHLALLGKIEGQIQDHTVINIFNQPQYLTIIGVLRDQFPEAAIAVSEALGAIEAGDVAHG